METTSTPKRYTTSELARIMKVSRPTVSRWARKGCPHLITGEITQGKNARPRFILEEVDAWLKSRQPNQSAYPQPTK